MLTRLLPDQISAFWDIIKYAIEESLPPTVGDHPDKMNRILTSLLSGKMQCWASYERLEGLTKFDGILVTTLIHDDASNTRNLLMYCVYGYDAVSDESWRKGFEAIIKYAKGKKCSRVVAYSDLPYIIEKTKQYGGEAKYTFLSFDVAKFVKLLNNLE